LRGKFLQLANQKFSLGLEKALQKAPRIAMPIDQPAE
jgi:hypothetical protein